MLFIVDMMGFNVFLWLNFCVEIFCMGVLVLELFLELELFELLVFGCLKFGLCDRVWVSSYLFIMVFLVFLVK